jgi:hypothetical protein
VEYAVESEVESEAESEVEKKELEELRKKKSRN